MLLAAVVSCTSRTTTAAARSGCLLPIVRRDQRGRRVLLVLWVPRVLRVRLVLMVLLVHGVLLVRPAHKVRLVLRVLRDQRARLRLRTVAPGSPTAGQLWYYTDAVGGGGQLYISYNDGNTTMGACC